MSSQQKFFGNIPSIILFELAGVIISFFFFGLPSSKIINSIFFVVGVFILYFLIEELKKFYQKILSDKEIQTSISLKIESEEIQTLTQKDEISTQEDLNELIQVFQNNIHDLDQKIQDVQEQLQQSEKKVEDLVNKEQSYITQIQDLQSEIDNYHTYNQLINEFLKETKIYLELPPQKIKIFKPAVDEIISKNDSPIEEQNECLRTVVDLLTILEKEKPSEKDYNRVKQLIGGGIGSGLAGPFGAALGVYIADWIPDCFAQGVENVFTASQNFGKKLFKSFSHIDVNE